MTSPVDQPDLPVRAAEPVPLPPPRPGVRHVNVVFYGVVIADDDLRTRIDRLFHWPMITLALLILPLLLVDFLYFQRQASNPEWVKSEDWLFWLANIGFAVIWLAFLIEFIVKITVAESRFEYVKRNWLDVIIIMVPMLRPIRAASLAKTSRVFTLRGVGMKFARYGFTAVIGLEATERLLHRIGLKSAAGRRDPAIMTRHDLTAEVKKLRRLTDAWEKWYVQHQAYIERHGHEPFTAPKPEESMQATDEEERQ